MPFTEAVKLQVKKLADFRCCRCREIGIDIHHIIPQAEDGSDDIDNAAPLCQNCHDRYGANPEKRKEIRQMRDVWYELVKEKYPGSQVTFEKLNEALLKVQANIQESNQVGIDKLRSEIIEEVREILVGKQQVAEQIKYVPANEIVRYANSVVGSTSGSMPLTLRNSLKTTLK
jgi:hypothetical protein